MKTIIINNVKTKLVPLEIAIAEDDGVSRNLKNRAMLEEERRNVLHNLFPGYVIDLMYDFKDLKNDYAKLEFEKNNLVSEISIYKNNIFFRGVLKMMRLMTHIKHTS